MWLPAHRARDRPVARRGSARPALSSARGRSDAMTTYTEATTARITMIIEAKDSTVLVPPNLRSASWTWSMFFSMSSASPRIDPYIAPITKSPAANPATTERWSRSAHPSGWTSAPDAVGLPGRPARSPAPTSRRVDRTNPVPAQSAARATQSSSGHQRLST